MQQRFYSEDAYTQCESRMQKWLCAAAGAIFVTLKLTTEDGIYGLGDATLNGRELAVASYLTDHVIPLLIGRDARRIEDTWQYLYKGAYWRRGPGTMTAIAAVDTALRDIKGKALHVPVYQLLGGTSCDGVLVYGHASGNDIEDTAKAVGEYLALGYKAIGAQSGIPGLKSTYGVGRGKMHYESAEPDAPPENLWSTERYLEFVPQLFGRLRREFGEEIHLLHDAHHRLTPRRATRPRCRHRRGASRELPVPAGLSVDKPEAGWHHAQLVSQQILQKRGQGPVCLSGPCQATVICW